MTPAVAYRPARPDDMITCARIWSESIEDYVKRLNQPWFAGDLEPLARLLGHFLATDPALFRVGTSAKDPGRVVAFGSATVRGSTWFLGMLFVLPEFQAGGVGRTLLEQLLPPVEQRGRDGLTLGTATDSLQPISNALYSQYGLVPRLPVFQFVGRPERTDHLPHLPDGVAGTEWSTDGDTTLAGDVGRLDVETLGAAHPEDHAFLAAERRRRFVYWSGANEAVGYGYIAPSGRIGPI
ncbi:MAG: GNAT family N-acetyltransferase, partial [Candidatus Limnocylindrales bacterium]